jgi:hypothetical protein
VEGVHALGKQAYVATWGGTGLSHRLRKISFDHIDMLDGLHLFEAEKHSDNQDDRGREGDESAAQTFVEELERAEQKFSGSYVGLSYFVTRWRSNTLTAAPDMRRRLLDQLIDEDRIEVYDAQDGSKAIRLS